MMAPLPDVDIKYNDLQNVFFSLVHVCVSSSLIYRNDQDNGS